MEIVLPLFVILVLSLAALGLWAYVRLEQHKIRYGNPTEIANLKAKWLNTETSSTCWTRKHSKH